MAVAASPAPMEGKQQSAVCPFIVLYDGQCEICQAYVSWLHILDKRGATNCVSVDADRLAELNAGLDLDACLRELHVVGPDGELHVGWDAVSRLARLFWPTWWIGVLGSLPLFRQIGRLAYRFVARNRYALSKCRGGSCRVANPQQVRKRARLGTFWSCYTLGFLIRFPLVLWAACAAAIERVMVFARTHGERYESLGGRLQILVLNGFFPNAVPLIFGELFTAILYDGVMLDPGSPRMRRSLARQLRRLEARVTAVVATHHHEEHVGNLDWMSTRVNAPVYASEATLALLRAPARIPRVRSLIIGQPLPLRSEASVAADCIVTASGRRLIVIPTPGHCDDHIVLFDAEEKLLLAGDSFMGSYFSTPNPDVDSLKWIETLRRLRQLGIEILVEGHGHIHTLRRDIPDIPGLVIRQDPVRAIEAKLEYLLWLREQVESGFGEGLPARAIEASCFPWGARTTWENFAGDETIRVLSLGHFSRSELVRSFVRMPDAALPTVYEVRLHRD